MSSNIREFTLGLDAFADEVPAEASRVQRAATLEGFRQLLQISPVDKGTFRANWQIGETTAPGDTVPWEGGEDRVTNGNRAASAAMGRELPKIAKLGPFTISWIANNLSYAERLNNGWSEQAPANFVERIVAALEDKYG